MVYSWQNLKSELMQMSMVYFLMVSASSLNILYNKKLFIILDFLTLVTNCSIFSLVLSTRSW